MTATLLVIHIILAISLIAVILVQRTSSDGGGLMGGGGGSSNMGGLMSVRGTANLLTRMTSFLAAGFVATSILLTILGGTAHRATSLTDEVKPAVEQKTETPAGDAKQSVPAVPLSK